MDKRKLANQRVKKNIADALFQLLANKSISKISVSEIIQTAGVARASFYRNYATKENIVTTLIDDILEQYRAALRSDGENFYIYENVYRAFEFFKTYGGYACDLHRFGYGSLMLDRLNQFHEEIAGTMPHSSIERYRLYSYMGALYNTAITWLRSGAQESVADIVDLFCDACGVAIDRSNARILPQPAL